MAELFTTERVIVRHLTRGDVDAMLEVYGDDEAMRWVGDATTLDRDQCLEWVDVTLRNYERRGYGMFAVVRIETRETIGFCGIVHPDDQVEAEIKYAFRRTDWGRGYATETVLALLDHARSLSLPVVIATIASANSASQRVVTKCGFQRRGPRDDGTLVFELYFL